MEKVNILTFLYHTHLQKKIHSLNSRILKSSIITIKMISVLIRIMKLFLIFN